MDKEKILKELSDEIYKMDDEFNKFSLLVLNRIVDFRARHRYIMDTLLELEISHNLDKNNNEEEVKHED